MQHTIIYKLGNFANGKVKETESKSATNTYINMGYKLITVAYLTTAEYLNWTIKFIFIGGIFVPPLKYNTPIGL
jgi:hypothetical protein